MTPLKTELNRLKEICGKATSGPFDSYFETGLKPMVVTYAENEVGGRTLKECMASMDSGNFATCVLFAESRTALPKLIAALEVAVGALEKMKDVEVEEEPGVLSWEASTCRNALAEIEKLLTEEK